MDLVEIDGKKPLVSGKAYVDPRAVLIGEVTVEEGVGIWPGVVVRADDAAVLIKAGAMLLENVIIEAPVDYPVVIGPKVIISHGAIVHGATIGKNSVVGIGAIVLDGAVVESNTIIGAGALVAPGKEIPAGKMVLGLPGKVVRDLTPREIAGSAKEWAALSKKLPGYIVATQVHGSRVVKPSGTVLF